MRITKWGELGILSAAFIARRSAASSGEGAASGEVATLDNTAQSSQTSNADTASLTSGIVSVSAQEIATALAIDIDYTRQVLQRLKNGGIVTTQRGPHGGYSLAAPPSEITMASLLHACEGGCFEVSCHSQPLHDSCNKVTARCNLKNFWLDLESHITSFLDSHTLKDLLDLDATWLPGHPDANELVSLAR